MFLGSIELGFLSLQTKLALLELRTLVWDNAEELSTGARATKDTSLVTWVDDFIVEHLKPKERKIVLDRWNSEAGERTLENVAEINGITRERVRQIVAKIKDQFSKLYFSEEDDWILKYFKDLIMQNISAIRYDDIISDENVKLAFNKNLYIGFLAFVLECVPFEKRRYGYLPSRLGYNIIGSEYYNLEDELYEMASIPNLVNLPHFLNEKDTKSQLKYLKAILVSEVLTITKHGTEVYVNRTSYGIVQLLRQCIREYDRPVEFEEFIDFLISNPFYPSKSHLQLTEQFGRKGSSPIAVTLNRVDDFIRLDRYVWGFEKHVSYPKIQWRDIEKACRDVLTKLGHQASTTYLFEIIQDYFPDLRSKYELNYILQRDLYLSYLGFMTFTLKSGGQKERLKIKDLVVKLFEEDPTPKSGDDIFLELEKVRTMPTREGQSTILRHIEGLKYYRPSYFGLDRFHRENLDHLSKHEPYLKLLLSRMYPHTYLEDIMEELEVGESPESYLSFLNQCKSIIHWELNQQHFFTRKDSSNFMIVLTILAQSNKPMFLDELILVLKSRLGNIKIEKIRLRRDLDSDPRIGLLKSGEYKYVDIVDHIDQYRPLLDEIEDYLLHKGQLVDVFDLHKHVDEFSENDKPSEPEEFLGLFKFDNRFKVLADGLVGIL